MKIVFIQTGGTIDKDYPRITKGWNFEIGEPAVVRILEKLNPSFEYDVISICKKDSQELTEEDRVKLLDYINKDKEENYIITHGTDTMIETAQFLDETVKGYATVVLTGSMRPEQFSNSDAPINIGCAIGAIIKYEPGVYVSMHGIIKKAKDIKRNLENGKFY